MASEEEIKEQKKKIFGGVAEDIEDFDVFDNKVLLYYEGRLDVKLNDIVGNKLDISMMGFDYSTFGIFNVLKKGDNSKENVKKGDYVVLELVYLTRLRDVFEGYSHIDKNYFIVPDIYIAGKINIPKYND